MTQFFCSSSKIVILMLRDLFLERVRCTGWSWVTCRLGYKGIKNKFMWRRHIAVTLELIALLCNPLVATLYVSHFGFFAMTFLSYDKGRRNKTNFDVIIHCTFSNLVFVNLAMKYNCVSRAIRQSSSIGFTHLLKLFNIHPFSF